MKSLLIILLFCFFIFFCFYLYFYLSKYLQKDSIKTFILDQKNKKIVFFSHDNFKKIKVLKLEEFFSCYERNINLINWINEKHKIDDVLKIETKKIFIFKVINIDKNNVYFNCYSFRYFKKNEDNLSLNNFIGSDLYLNGFIFNFYIKNQNNKKDIIIFSKLKEIIFFYIKNCYFFEKNNKLIVFCFKNKNYEKIKFLAEKIINLMYCFLRIEGYENIFIAVGIVDNSKFKSIAKSFNKSENLALKALRLNKKIEIYDPNVIDNNDYTFIKQNMPQLFWHFDFIFNVISEDKLGFLTYIKFNNKKIEEKTNKIFNYSIKNYKKNKLIEEIFQKLVKIVDLKKNLLLFCDYCPNLIDFLSFDKNNDFVFCFNEKIIDFYIDNKNISFLEEIFDKIKAKKNFICLKLNYLTAENLLMNLSLKELVQKFDYFIVDLDKLKRNWYKIFRNIIEILLSYKKTIIVNCNGNWQLTKLVIKSGIKFIINSSLDNKKKAKIRKIVENIY